MKQTLDWTWGGGGTRLGRLEGAKEVPVAASLPDIWEELITELQFSQSLAAKSEAGRAASEWELLIQPLFDRMSQVFCSGKCCIVLSGISSSMDPIRENCLITLFLTDWGKTAGFAFLKINLQQISCDYGLNFHSCLFISFPGLRNLSEIQ